jgi:putative ABC transport system ATP-binding protein
MDLLIETARQENATVVLVTHDARVAAYAERMVMVRDGKVIAPAETASEVVR